MSCGAWNPPCGQHNSKQQEQDMLYALNLIVAAGYAVFFYKISR
jgi:hypothetical protein